MKIAINTCYGGFSLSGPAIEYYLNLKNIPYKKEVSQLRLFGESDHIYRYDVNYFTESSLDRTDPALIQTIQDLGTKANGRFSDLRIIDIPDDVNYIIHDYDGIETVVDADRIWS